LGLKVKITFLIILNVAGVLFFSSYLDFHFAKKGQIGLFLDRNLYIAKQIDIARQLGLSKAEISKSLKLLDMPEETQSKFTKAKVAKGILYEIVTARSEIQTELVDKAISGATRADIRTEKERFSPPKRKAVPEEVAAPEPVPYVEPVEKQPEREPDIWDALVWLAHKFDEELLSEIMNGETQKILMDRYLARKAELEQWRTDRDGEKRLG